MGTNPPGEPTVRPPTPRAAVRRKLFHPAWLDTADGRHRAHVLNMSAIGACVHARCVHRVWSGVTLQLDELTLKGRVTWADGERCGIKFVYPLAAKELDQITGY
ncbi:MAG: Pilus assembly protein PilZ [Sphingomonas bacterium]|uniref:PilZ domain-containing protein n=1 Tax=Sphingomonas bacterium TaxID=1895847 RepID=UPI0026398D48|nr:PilZ domain-containing protein [Sphingomonas bacterium]MDB5695061.1 Pilus assembly protein PilZ [Sphingomonas bacterium]